MELFIRTMAVRKNRKGSRKSRTRRNRRNMYGGALSLAPMDLNDTSMAVASKMSGGQGLDFLNKHAAQHGGGLLAGAPVGDTGMLDESLRASARMAPLDASYKAIVGMKDQSGGRRNRRNRRDTRRNRRDTRRNRRDTRRNRRNRRGTRRQGGGMRALGFMEADAPGLLLSGNQATAAQSTMSKEWALAENPNSFAPKMGF